MNAIEWQQWININQIEQEMQMPTPAQLVIYHMSYMYVCIYTMYISLQCALNSSGLFQYNRIIAQIWLTYVIPVY